MGGIRWFLFDVGGVLCTARDDEWPAAFASQWAARLGLGVDELDARIEAANLPDPTIERGVERVFWQGFGEALGATADDLEAMRSDFWDYYCGDANAELLDFAAELRGRYRLAILSNSGDGAREQEERRFGFSKMFDPICYSHEIGVIKPDPRTFRIALDRMNAAADEVVFIDNVAENVEAAARAGMQTVLHAENDSTIAALRGFVEGTA